MVKFLVIRFSSIGDIVLTTPVVRSLKEQVEEAEVHYLTKKSFKGIVESNPYIDKVHLLEDNFTDMIDSFRDEMFDYIIDLHSNLRTTRVKSKLKVPDFSFNKLNWEKWVYVNFKKNLLPDVHIVDRYMDTLKVFDVKNDQKGLDYYIPAEDEVSMETLPGKFSNGYISLVIGANHFTKKLPMDKMISICKKIDLPIIVQGGPDNIEEGEALAKAVGDNIYNACGNYNLNQSASLVRQAKVVISHDTGLMHIAAAFKKKIISVWGNTVPEFGMAPYLPDEDSAIVQVDNLKCRPCSKIGFKECPKKHFKCMNDINEDHIVKLAKRMMKS